MDFTSLIELKNENIILRKLTVNDQQLIADLFNDIKVRDHYIIPKEANRDHRNLFAYLMNDF